MCLKNNIDHKIRPLFKTIPHIKVNDRSQSTQRAGCEFKSVREEVRIDDKDDDDVEVHVGEMFH